MSVTGSHRKPLDRQVSEFIGIRKAKTSGKAKVEGKEMKLAKEVFNSKEEWFSHSSQWDVVG